MASNTIRETGELMLRALDPDLPMVASQAAIELDNLILGKGADLQAVNVIAQLLENSIEVDQASGAYRAAMDSASVELMSRTLDASYQEESFDTLEQLLTLAHDIADDLRKAGADTNEEDLKGMRGFCVALSRSAASYLRSAHDLRPSHPYRR